MTNHFHPLTKKKHAITYIERIYKIAIRKLKRVAYCHKRIPHSPSQGWSQGPPRQSVLLLKENNIPWSRLFSRWNTTYRKTSQVLKELDAPECRRDILKVMSCLGVYSCSLENCHANSQLFYILSKVLTSPHWTDEHENCFQSIKEKISEDTNFAVHSRDYTFLFLVTSSKVGTGCILIEQFPEGERILSFNTRVFDKD